MTARLDGKHALLTGAGGGIGLAVAEAYLREGARCTVADLAATPGAPVQALMREHGDCLHYVQADVTQAASIAALLLQSNQRFGAVEILYNNAAVFDMAPLLDSSEAMYERLFAVNVKGMFFVMQAVLRQMVDAGVKGSIINLASQAGRRGEALVAHYCASKRSGAFEPTTWPIRPAVFGPTTKARPRLSNPAWMPPAYVRSPRLPSCSPPCPKGILGLPNPNAA